jgi:preprotein translocase subunit SecE
MFGKVGGFFSESKQELAKVNWPSREELIGSTLLVIVVTLILATFVFGIDLVLSFLMRILIR